MSNDLTNYEYLYKQFTFHDENNIYQEIKSNVKDINSSLRPSSRIRLREDAINCTLTKHERIEYLISLRSQILGLRHGETYIQQNKLKNDADAKIEEIAAFYFVYDYVLKTKPPIKSFPHSTFSDIQKDAAKASLISILSNYYIKEKSIHLWQNIPSYWKRNDDIVFAAHRGHHICNPINSKEYPCLFDTQKIMKMLVQEKIEWTLLPNQIRNDRSFAEKVLRYGQPTFVMDGSYWIKLMVQICKEHHDLLLDRNLWLQIFLPNCEKAMQCMDDDNMKSAEWEQEMIFLLDDIETIKADIEVMTYAIKVNIISFCFIHDNLIQDKFFIHENIMKFPQALYLLPEVWLRTHKEFVMKELLQKFQCTNYYYGTEILGNLIQKFSNCNFWIDNEFTNQWLRQGFPILICNDHYHPQSWSSDKGKFLDIARYCKQIKYVLESYQEASSKIRNDRDFFIQAMQYNKYIICYASEELKRDDELMINAIASSSSFIEFYMKQREVERSKFRLENEDENVDYDDNDDEGYFMYLQSKLCNELNYYDNFFTILCYISYVKPWNLLNQGEETSMKYKKLIAEYLDVNTGKELVQARRAFDHLSRALLTIQQ